MSDDLSIASLFDVKGKVAVVTGGGSGIGSMIAAAYVQNGAKVYIAARKEKQLKDVCDMLNAKGPGSCHYFVADLMTKAGCDKLAASVMERESKVHILVNNSGMTWGARYDDRLDRVLALNVKSIFYLTVALTDVLARDATARDPGRVINISSIGSIASISFDSRVTGGGGIGLWSYNTSKAAVNHLTTQLASTLTRKCITVNAVLPGIFHTNMTAFGFGKNGEDNIAKTNPFGRVGEARDMAGVALFLASPAAAYVTGTHVVVDGGSVISTKMKAKL